MIYRREIDGLRALAVVPVILCHAGFEGFRGGFVGVDIFFVISGYLITSLILEEMKHGTFTLLGFYERRARRILPALFLVMAACVPFALAMMSPGQLKDFSQSLVAVTIFASNILFLDESGYFGAAADEKPLLHTWSLAVEEQFYILFPLLVIALWRFGRGRLAAVVGVIAVTSFAAAEWGWRTYPEANYFLTPTRAWELMIGSLAAFYSSRFQAATAGRPDDRSQALSALGVALIVFSIVAFDSSTPFPSAYTLVPTVGAALIILYAREGTWVARLLSQGVFVGIGLISYSAYLWHQPLFAFARIGTTGPVSTSVMVALIGLCFALAYLSWRFVETPFRDRSNVTARAIFTTGGALSTFMIVIGIGGHIGNGFEAEPGPRGAQFLRSYAGRDLAINHYKEDCNFHLRFEIAGDCLTQTGTSLPVTLIWGDSHAQAVAVGLREKYSANSFFAQVATSSCLPALVDIEPDQVPVYSGGINGNKGAACQKANATALELIRSGTVSTVVLAVRENHEDVDWKPIVEAARKHGVARIFIIGPVPQWKSELPLLYALSLDPAQDAIIHASLDKQIFEDDTALMRELRPLLAEPGVVVLSPVQHLCRDADICTYKVPELRPNDRLLSWDYGHLSFSGSVYLADLLFKKHFGRGGTLASY